MKEVEEEMPGAVDVSGRMSKVLERWIQDPRVDRVLASKVLREVQTKVEVHVGRDYTLDVEYEYEGGGGGDARGGGCLLEEEPGVGEVDP